MIWEQMEMRAGVVVELLEEMFGAGGEEDDEEGPDGDGSDGSEDGFEGGEFDSDLGSDSDEVTSSEASFHEEHFTSALGPEGVDAPAGESDDEQPADPLADENAGLTLDTFDSPGGGRPQRRFVSEFSFTGLGQSG